MSKFRVPRGLEVSGLRVVVVGASTGLGRSLGIGLGKRGAKVALLARRESLLDEAAKEAGPASLAIRCDVTDESSCLSAIGEAAKGLGGVDVVIVVAGISELRRVEEIDAAVVASNVRHKRGRGITNYGGGASPLEGIGRDDRLPILGQCITHCALAGPGRVYRDEGRARQVGRGLAS